MEKFDFFLGLSLAMRILKHAEGLISSTLQKKDLSACEAQEIAQITVKSLSSIRNDESFDLFWQRVIAESERNEVSQPQLPRRRNAPQRIDKCVGGTAQAAFPATVAEISQDLL